MKEAFEKIMEQLEEPQFNIGCGACPIKEKCDEVQETIDDEMTDLCAETMRVIAKEIVQEVEKEYNNGWIPCSERLPEEPEEGLTDLDECDEYIAMIENADIPTALNYAGNGEWYRDGEFYKVIAWQPLPEPYKENKKRIGRYLSLGGKK